MMEKLKKIAIVTTHPIQYNAPLFKLLAERNKVRVKVFYTWGESVLKSKYDPGFKKEIEWDIPLLEGYEYEFLENIAVDKGSHHFKGIDNPGSIQAIASYEPNAILIYGWAFKSHLRLIRYFHKKIPIIFRGDSTLLDEVGDGYKSVLRKFFLRWVYKKVDYALYVGKNNFDYFKRAALRKDHLIYAPHAVDNDRFEASDRSIEQAAHYRRKLGINDGGIVFLFAGKLETKKDPALLLRAFVDSGLCNNSHLVFVGNGPLEREIKDEAKNITSVHFMDFQNQSKMPSVYQMADIFVLPSRGPGETWGLVLNESMAAGCAVIASNKCGGAIDLIEDSKNGFIFQAGNKDDLITKMKMIYSQSCNLESMKRSSIQKVKAFCFSNIAEAIESVVLSLPRTKADIKS